MTGRRIRGEEVSESQKGAEFRSIFRSFFRCGSHLSRENSARRKPRLYMRPRAGASRQEQPFAADFGQGQGKSVQLSEEFRSQGFLRGAHAEAPVTEQQQETRAIARGKQQI